MEDAALRAQDDAAAAVAVAPRVTIDFINDHVVQAENYFTAAEAALALGQPVTPSMELLTLCVLTLRNGFTVTGESACASPENFNAELGRTIARRNAVEKIWMLEGYLLRERLANGAQSA